LHGVISQTSRRGTDVMQVWPRKRGTPKSPVTIEQNSGFVRLNAMQKAMTDDEKVAARDIAYASGYTWRDVLARALVGRLIVWGPDLSDDIQVLLDSICTNHGALLIRTVFGWQCLLPSTDDYVLTIDPSTHLPAYLPPQGGGSSGLFGPVLSATPTQAVTGLTTWAAQGSSSVADTAFGMTLTGANAGANDHWSLLHKPVPATPYSVTVLLAATYTGSNIGGALLGWYDGTAKLHGARLINNGGTWQLFVSSFTNLTTFSANQLGPLSAAMVTMLWLRLRDDGTNVSIWVSSDGANFQSIYTVAKSAGPNGATGYSHIALGTEANSKPCFASLFSYLETSP
jgi:hypothetical protein